MSIHQVDSSRLDAVNAVIASAIETWNLSPRLARLSLTSLRYTATDLAHQQLMEARIGKQCVGVLALEPCRNPGDETGVAGPAALLHGLYVAHSHQQHGIGTHLLKAAAGAARDAGFTGLLVKAQPSANPFFEHQGLQRLPAGPDDYPHRWWMPLSDQRR